MAAEQTLDIVRKAGFTRAELHRVLHRLVLRRWAEPGWQPASNVVLQHCKNYRFVRGLLNARNARKPKSPV